MNKMRRRYAKARRRKVRLTREMQEWTKTNWTGPPKRGRLRQPAINLMLFVDETMARGKEQLHALMAPILAFAGRASHSPKDPR